MLENNVASVFNAVSKYVYFWLKQYQDDILRYEIIANITDF
jgi:hypothetical protein